MNSFWPVTCNLQRVTFEGIFYLREITDEVRHGNEDRLVLQVFALNERDLCPTSDAFVPKVLLFLEETNFLLTPFLTSLAFVALAEMGDKTQLLAMAFASRYRWQTVLWAIFIATLCNHFIAVLVGSLLTNLVPLQSIKIAGSASFILFGLWTLRGDELSGEQERTRWSPFWTVAIAFFMAEMGDKTQLATCALATRYERILPIWLGTTAGMIVADALGIGVGIVLGKKIPERAIQWFAASVFIAFGLVGLYEAGSKDLASPLVLGGGAFVLCALIYLAIYRRKKGKPHLLEPQDRVDAQGKDSHAHHRPLEPNG